MDTQFNNAIGQDENMSHIRNDLRLFWERFGSGTFRTTRVCRNCQDEQVQNPEFTELIVPVIHNSDNITLEDLILDDSSTRDDDHEFRCERCNVFTQPIRTTRIEGHPVIMCVYVNRLRFDAENNRPTRLNTRVPFPMVDFNPNNNLGGDDGHQTYDLISGIFHWPTSQNSGHYTAICSTGDNWITYDDTIFKTNEFLNRRARIPTPKVCYHKGAYMLFYKRRDTVSIGRDTESNHGGPEDDDYSENDERFSTVDNTDDDGLNVNNPNGFNVSDPSVRENTNELDNQASSVTMSNINNPTESSYSSQSAEENTNGHANDSPSTSVVATNDIQPQTSPTQQNRVRQIALINLATDTDDDEDDPTCQMCQHTIESDNDIGTIDTGRECTCDNLQFHSFCLRRYRNECAINNIPMRCEIHGNEIRHVMNNDGVNSIDGDITCLICMESLDTDSNWGRFVCNTCRQWYHYDCLETYAGNRNSYHRDNRRGQYDMTRLKCIICKRSPRTIERLFSDYDRI